MNAIEYAIAMEVDGEEYYTKQAEINKDNAVGVVSRYLAKAEHSHAEILRNKQSNMDAVLPETEYADLKNVFSGRDNIKSDIQKTPKQLDFYRQALDIEQKSIDLYAQLLNETQDAREKALFSYLVEQEKQHFQLVEGFVNMLRHAEEWVEDAEFGLRNETY